MYELKPLSVITTTEPVFVRYRWPKLAAESRDSWLAQRYGLLPPCCVVELLMCGLDCARSSQLVWCSNITVFPYLSNEFDKFSVITTKRNDDRNDQNWQTRVVPKRLYFHAVSLSKGQNIKTYAYLSASNLKSQKANVKMLPCLRHPPLSPPAAVLGTDSWPAELQPEICGGWWWRCCRVRPCGSAASENPGMKMELGGGGGRSYGSDQRMRSPGVSRGWQRKRSTEREGGKERKSRTGS